ncbi:MAG: hypothetical protein ACHQ2Z_17200, partial [Elusimicrobiota bacterium]
MRYLIPLAVLLLSACGGARLRDDEHRLAEANMNNDVLAAALKAGIAELDSLMAAKADAEAMLADAEAKLSDASGKLAIASDRVDSLTKSNKDLSDASGASQTELGVKLNGAIAEKDALARSLAEAQQKQLSAVRLKAIYRSARDKAAADLAAAEKERTALKEKVDACETWAEKGKAQAAADLAARKAKAHEDMGSVADVILPDILAGREFAAVTGDAVIEKLPDDLLFHGFRATLSDGGEQALERVGRAL